MSSFKQLIKEGNLKRADAMKARLDDIHEEPGFNLRTESADLQESIRALAHYIAAGGIIPALEVRPRAEGGVWVVDGHRRRRALRIARDELGAPVEWVNIVAFVGNDADRTARIISSAEGRGLSMLEVGRGYLRLHRAFNKSLPEIASMFGKTPQHVAHVLVLATANADVQQLVEDGRVSGSHAVAVVRQHGEGAGDVLRAELDKAAQQGKARVTPAMMHPRRLPARITDEVVGAAESFVGGLDARVLQTLQGLKSGRLDKGATVQVPAEALQKMLDALQQAQAARDKQQARAARAQAQAAQACIQDEDGAECSDHGAAAGVH